MIIPKKYHIVPTMRENRFLLFLTRLCSHCSIPKSFALLLSFHCFRHSFATNQLTLGTAITTVSKLLGHRDLKTTMVYAKVVDSAKREAVDKLKLDIAPIILRKGGAI